MSHDTLFWLIMLLLSTALMSFYSMQEMAVISYSRIRLSFQAKSGKLWAKWLQELTERPTLLFSTTLIGVNAALMISSECSRRVYDSLGWNENWAPLFEIPFILLFGELVPMFAARGHPEHMCRLGIPFLYLSAKVFKPLADVVDLFFRKTGALLGQKKHQESEAFLSRAELQQMLEEHEAGLAPEGEEEVDEMVGNMFTFQTKTAALLMDPLFTVPLLSSHASVKEAKELFQKTTSNSLLLFHRHPQKIIGLVQPFDLVDIHETKKVQEHMRAACFVSAKTHSFELLHRMQEESAPLAVVLDSAGTSIGVVQRDDLARELIVSKRKGETQSLFYLEKSVPADMPLEDFNQYYGTKIELEGCTTFHDLIEKTLSRHPQPGDTIFIEPFDITVKETSLFKAKEIQIKTR